MFHACLKDCFFLWWNNFIMNKLSKLFWEINCCLWHLWLVLARIFLCILFLIKHEYPNFSFLCKKVCCFKAWWQQCCILSFFIAMNYLHWMSRSINKHDSLIARGWKINEQVKCSKWWGHQKYCFYSILLNCNWGELIVNRTICACGEQRFFLKLLK